jgi:hypothetical protein
MTPRQPFSLASDYIPVDEEPFELHSDTPVPTSHRVPMTMPQRMHALEVGQVAQRKDIKVLDAKMDKVLKKLSWRQTAKTVGYPVASAAATAAATHYPQFKPILDAVLGFFSGQ